MTNVALGQLINIITMTTECINTLGTALPPNLNPRHQIYVRVQPHAHVVCPCVWGIRLCLMSPHSPLRADLGSTEYFLPRSF
jgi:hypothetical protein